MRRPSGTRQEIRAGLLAEVKRALAAAMLEHGVSERELAASCGRSRALIGRWLDLSDPCRPGIEDAATMPEPLAEALLRVYADHLGRVVGVAAPAAPGSSLADHRRHLAQVVRELGEASAAYASAVADDVVTDEELAAVEREAQQAAEAAAGLVKWARESRAARVRRPRVQ